MQEWAYDASVGLEINLYDAKINKNYECCPAGLVPAIGTDYDATTDGNIFVPVPPSPTPIMVRSMARMLMWAHNVVANREGDRWKHLCANATILNPDYGASMSSGVPAWGAIPLLAAKAAGYASVCSEEGL